MDETKCILEEGMGVVPEKGDPKWNAGVGLGRGALFKPA